MKTDRELLELAAKAAGLVIDKKWQAERDLICNHDTASLFLVDGSTAWNPLKDDGDALRLAVKLQLGISVPPVVDGRIEVVTFYGHIISIVEYPQNDDRQAATRRAITRAAAQIQLDKEKQ